MSIVALILLVALLILVHEFGHFYTAKKCGVPVDEFGIGYPPKFWSKKFRGTEYSLNWIPFGGFVRIRGMEITEEEDGTDKGSFFKRPKRVQAIVVLGGVLANLLLAWVVISGGYLFGLPVPADAAPKGAELSDVHLYVLSVADGSPAEKAGLKAGDEIVYLASNNDAENSPTPLRVQEIVKNADETGIAFGYKRNGGDVATALLVPVMNEEVGKKVVGISMDYVGLARLGLFDAVFTGLKDTLVLSQNIAIGLFDFFKNIFVGERSVKEISGPIGIVKIMNDTAKVGWVYLLNLMAILSVNLAVLNLIPFPALDGGWLLFTFLELANGKPLSKKSVGYVYGAGYSFLIILMLVVTWNDIAKLVF